MSLSAHVKASSKRMISGEAPRDNYCTIFFSIEENFAIVGTGKSPIGLGFLFNRSSKSVPSVIERMGIHRTLSQISWTVLIVSTITCCIHRFREGRIGCANPLIIPAPHHLKYRFASHKFGIISHDLPAFQQTLFLKQIDASINQS